MFQANGARPLGRRRASSAGKDAAMADERPAAPTTASPQPEALGPQILKLTEVVNAGSSTSAGGVPPQQQGLLGPAAPPALAPQAPCESLAANAAMALPLPLQLLLLVGQLLPQSLPQPQPLPQRPPLLQPQIIPGSSEGSSLGSAAVACPGTAAPLILAAPTANAVDPRFAAAAAAAAATATAATATTTSTSVGSVMSTAAAAPRVDLGGSYGHVASPVSWGASAPSSSEYLYDSPYDAVNGDDDDDGPYHEGAPSALGGPNFVSDPGAAATPGTPCMSYTPPPCSPPQQAQQREQPHHYGPQHPQTYPRPLRVRQMSYRQSVADCVSPGDIDTPYSAGHYPAAEYTAQHAPYGLDFAMPPPLMCDADELAANRVQMGLPYPVPMYDARQQIACPAGRGLPYAEPAHHGIPARQPLASTPASPAAYMPYNMPYTAPPCGPGPNLYARYGAQGEGGWDMASQWPQPVNLWPVRLRQESEEPGFAAAAATSADDTAASVYGSAAEAADDVAYEADASGGSGGDSGVAADAAAPSAEAGRRRGGAQQQQGAGCEQGTDATMDVFLRWAR
ncbi:hypothetical protein PLESTM_001307500 [Pleodorina starrii]|nr:hypothetical protein PLESTM_001307500 [Pleodorina starrii]